MSKIVIKCSKAEQKDFIKKACPEKFNDEWPSMFDLCDEHLPNITPCKECWSKYVEWVITDEI